MVAVKVTLTFSATGISISVDQEPVNLAASGDHDVEWTLDDTSYGLGWTFASHGIDIKAPATVFKNKKGSGNGKKHGWKSLTFDGARYRYTINLENLDTGAQLIWDPTIMN
jgi:hypothetical protein